MVSERFGAARIDFGLFFCKFENGSWDLAFHLVTSSDMVLWKLDLSDDNSDQTACENQDDGSGSQRSIIINKSRTFRDTIIEFINIIERWEPLSQK